MSRAFVKSAKRAMPRAVVSSGRFRPTPPAPNPALMAYLRFGGWTFDQARLETGGRR